MKITSPLPRSRNLAYQYVREYELPEKLMPRSFIAVRVDGNAFSQYTKVHKLDKPVDLRMHHLMADCGRTVFQRFPEILLAYGFSDEFSFILSDKQDLFKRSPSKLVSAFSSLFGASFIHNWSTHFQDDPHFLPTFDGRAVAYPTSHLVRDYLSWRQSACYSNYVYNKIFTHLLEENYTAVEATQQLEGYDVKSMVKMLHNRNITMDTIPHEFRKGVIFLRNRDKDTNRPTQEILRLSTLVTSPKFYETNIPELKY